MCLRARKTKRYGQRVPIVSYYVGSLAASGSNFLSSFKNLRRKGGKFDHRPGRPKVLLRHCSCIIKIIHMVHKIQVKNRENTALKKYKKLNVKTE